ncbi:MAG: hypothetical protein Kow00109_01140 [Acidobacteriota bacterium]
MRGGITAVSGTGGPLLTIRSLCKVYGPASRPALHPLDLDVAGGESVGIVGESGGGKTTLCRILLGLTPPTAGTVFLRGKLWVPARIPRKERWRVQGIFQDARLSLNPFMTVRKALLEAVELWPDRAGLHSVEDLLDAVGLRRGLADALPGRLSGGEAQRVALARALIPGPELLIADEPFSGLDDSSRRLLGELLLDLRKRFGLTLILVTHDLALARRLVERLCVFRAGRLVEAGPTPVVLQRPAHPYTQSLVAALRFERVPDTRRADESTLREVGPGHWAAV